VVIASVDKIKYKMKDDKFKIWHISDTHTYHELLNVPDDVDIVIFSGDSSNPKQLHINHQEVSAFLTWFGNLNIKYKIYVAGNHDSSIEAGYITKDDFLDKGIIYLENDFIEIEGIKIWGSPFTPTFGNWSFMKARAKLHDIWVNIPDDTDIIVVHGPPKGILDLSYNRDNIIEFCGCNALLKRVLQIEPKLFLSGHIHNNKDIINAGTIKLANYKTIFSNGSVVTDGKFGKLTSNGNILYI